MWTFRENHQEASITNVIVHVGTNHLPRDQPSNVTTKIRVNYYCMQRKNCQIHRLIHRKTLRFAFLKKIEIVLITSFTILLNYTVSTLPLSNHFYPSIITHKTQWPNRQDRPLLTYGTFKNAGSKPVRGRFHGCGTLTSKVVLGT